MKKKVVYHYAYPIPEQKEVGKVKLNGRVFIIVNARFKYAF